MNWLLIVQTAEPDDAEALKHLGHFKIKTPYEVLYLKSPIEIFLLSEKYRVVRNEADRFIYLTNIFDNKKIKAVKKDGTPYSQNDYDKTKDTFQTLWFVLVKYNDDYIPAIFILKKSALKELYEYKQKIKQKSLIYNFFKLTTSQQKKGSVRYYVPQFEITHKDAVEEKFLTTARNAIEDFKTYVEAYNENFLQLTQQILPEYTPTPQNHLMLDDLDEF